MGLLFFKTSPVKKYAYENDFSGALDVLNKNFLVIIALGHEYSVVGLGFTVLVEFNNDVPFVLYGNEQIAHFAIFKEHVIKIQGYEITLHKLRSRAR